MLTWTAPSFVQQDLKRPASKDRTTPRVNFLAGWHVTEPRKRNAGASMPEWADENLATLVRRVIPPRRPDWAVKVVDNPEEAIFARDLVRVERHWRESVYETGLHSVAGRDLALHYPLDLSGPGGRGARVRFRWKPEERRTPGVGRGRTTTPPGATVAGSDTPASEAVERSGEPHAI
jgi:hypothetical protein